MVTDAAVNAASKYIRSPMSSALSVVRLRPASERKRGRVKDRAREDEEGVRGRDGEREGSTRGGREGERERGAEGASNPYQVWVGVGAWDA